MFNGADLYSVFGEYGASCRFSHIFCDSIDDGLSLHIDALDFIAMIVRRRIECHCQVQTGVQSFSTEGEAAFKCFLFQHGSMLICLIVSSVLQFPSPFGSVSDTCRGVFYR